jgi:hypothetical protein
MHAIGREAFVLVGYSLSSLKVHLPLLEPFQPVVVGVSSGTEVYFMIVLWYLDTP